MSRRTHLSTLRGKNKALVIDAMRANGLSREDIDMLLEYGVLADIEDYMDIRELNK